MVDEESSAVALTGGIGLTISEQCRFLALSRSGYYRWLHASDRKEPEEESRKLDEKKQKELELVKALLAAYSDHPSFGYRKMGHYLRGMGYYDATEKRIRLIYKRLGLKGAIPVFKTTRALKCKYMKFPYLLKNKPIRFANQVWATDITYIKLPGGMVYLTAVIDLFSRKILSWRLSETMKTDFCLEVLHEAVYKYGIPAIFNTDCGSQYLSNEFISALQGYGIEISMDSVGRCLDNIFVERTWRTVKYECVFLHDWKTKGELEDGLGIFIDDFNSVRPHEGLNYKTPDDVYKNGCFPIRDSNKETEVA